MIPLAEGRGRIARSSLLQSIGVGLPDPDLWSGFVSLSDHYQPERSTCDECLCVCYVSEWLWECIKKMESAMKEYFIGLSLTVHQPLKQNEKTLSNVKSSE